MALSQTGLRFLISPAPPPKASRSPWRPAATIWKWFTHSPIQLPVEANCARPATLTPSSKRCGRRTRPSLTQFAREVDRHENNTDPGLPSRHPPLGIARTNRTPDPGHGVALHQYCHPWSVHARDNVTTIGSRASDALLGWEAQGDSARLSAVNRREQLLCCFGEVPQAYRGAVAAGTSWCGRHVRLSIDRTPRYTGF
jgi:hypothetical protein